MLRRVMVLRFQVLVLWIALRATAELPPDPGKDRGLSLGSRRCCIPTSLVWLHYMVLLMIPFGTIAVAACVCESCRAGCGRLAMLSYCFIVSTTLLDANAHIPQRTFSIGALQRLLSWDSLCCMSRGLRAIASLASLYRKHHRWRTDCLHTSGSQLSIARRSRAARTTVPGCGKLRASPLKGVIRCCRIPHQGARRRRFQAPASRSAPSD